MEHLRPHVVATVACGKVRPLQGRLQKRRGFKILPLLNTNKEWGDETNTTFRLLYFDTAILLWQDMISALQDQKWSKLFWFLGIILLQYIVSFIIIISMTLKIIWIRNTTIMSKKRVDLIYLTDMMAKCALLEAPWIPSAWRPIRLQCQNGSVVCSPGVWCSRSPVSSRRFISLKGWDSNTQKTAEKMLNNCCSISNIHTRHFLESFLEWRDPTSINPPIVKRCHKLENPPSVRIIDDCCIYLISCKWRQRCWFPGTESGESSSQTTRTRCRCLWTTWSSRHKLLGKGQGWYRIKNVSSLKYGSSTLNIGVLLNKYWCSIFHSHLTEETATSELLNLQFC